MVWYDNIDDDMVEMYALYEGSNLPNQNSRKLGDFDQKLEGSHSLYVYHFGIF